MRGREASACGPTGVPSLPKAARWLQNAPMRVRIAGRIESRGRLALLVRGSAVAASLLLFTALAAHADYADGLAAFNSGDYARALREWKPLAERGDAHSQHGLGLLYETGKGLPQPDLAAAFGWYQKAAAQDLPAAQSNLGLMYAEGRGVPRDVPQAVAWWRKAAAGGHPMAQFNLGLIYYRGDGVPRAANWFAAAALNDVADAQFALAEMYRIGRGVMQSEEAARGWYVKAAENGNEAAARRLELYASEDAASGLADASAASALGPRSEGMEPTAALPPIIPPLPPLQPPAVAASERTGDTPSGAPAAPVPAPSSPTASAAPPAGAAPPATEPAASAPAESEPTAAPDGAPTAVPAGATASAEVSTAPPTEAPESGPMPTASSTVEPAPAAQQDVVGVAAEQPSLTGPAGPAATSPNTGVIRMATPVAQPVPEPPIYRIWLASLATAELADESWRTLVERYPDLLGGLALTVRKVDLGLEKGVWYRVLAGPFADRQSAKSACEEMLRRAPEESCMAVVN
jgi:TPR repeat protein